MPRVARPNRPLADVNLLPQRDGSHEVVVCFMPDAETLVGEGDARAVLSLDASRSIKALFGGGLFDPRPNYVQTIARKVSELLCGITRTGRVSLNYWAVGPGGAEVEPIGEYDTAGCQRAEITGPKRRNGWGTGTQLLPAVRHIVETVGRGADFTMGVILTDGIIEDEPKCLDYCLSIGYEMARGRRKRLKLVLIGAGEEVDVNQLERFNDMFEPTDLKGKVDLWAAGVAADMRDEADILGTLFAELWNDDDLVADSGSVLVNGRTVANFSDGLPGKLRFTLPRGAHSFTIHTPAGDVTQEIE